MTLYEIFEKVKMENARSKGIYGRWPGNYSHSEQAEAIRSEFTEWHSAYAGSDVDGEHGELTEIVHTINVLCRRAMFLTGEPDA